MDSSKASSTTFEHPYKTTRPIIPLASERLPIDIPIHQSLVVQLRAFRAADIEYVHRLRSQEIVMVQTGKGSIDVDITESQTWMDRYTPPNDVNTYNLMVWAKDGEHSWEHIGAMGSHVTSPVPHIGYMIRSEWWGKSIMTKTVQAFLQHWWDLPRKVVEVGKAEADNQEALHFMKLELSHHKTDNASGDIVPEIIFAEIESNNIGSIRVVTKCGFEYRGQRTITERGQHFTLLDYTCARPST